MATYTYSGTYSGSGNFQFSTTYDEIVFTSTANVYSSNSLGAVYGSQGDNSLRVDGAVRGLYYGARMSNDDNEITVGSNGSLIGTNYYGALMSGDDNSLRNDGSISGGYAGVYMSGDDATVENRGSIYGSAGVTFSSGEGSVLENSGDIVGDGDNDSDFFKAGVTNSQENFLLINEEDGRIEGTGDDTAGVKFMYDADDSVIENYGEITSDEWFGVDFSDLNNDATATLINEGVIEGAEGSFLGSEGDDTVINKGEMIGDVILDEGDDVYRSTGSGSVDGEVDGGEGEDLMIGGKADDVFLGGDDDDILRSRGGEDELSGGNGHDKVLGGGGDDELDGDAGNDRLVGGGGDDEMDGGSGVDILIGGRGDDEMTGGSSGDVFVFNRRTDNDRITDFGDGADKIDLSVFNIDSVSDLHRAGAIDELGGGTLIDLGEIGGRGTIFLEGFDADDLGNNDFIF